MLRGACFEAETISFSDWLVMWTSPTTVVPFSSNPTWHSPWWSLQLCTPRIFSYQRADQSEKTQGRHTECSVAYGPWPSQAERMLPDPVLPRMLHPKILKQINQEGSGLAGDLYGHIRFKYIWRALWILKLEYVTLWHSWAILVIKKRKKNLSRPGTFLGTTSKASAEEST